MTDKTIRELELELKVNQLEKQLEQQQLAENLGLAMYRMLVENRVSAQTAFTAVGVLTGCLTRDQATGVVQNALQNAQTKTSPESAEGDADGTN